MTDLSAKNASEDAHAIDVSIVVPAYNARLYLDRFFACAYRQTYAGFRIVFVDDCSTDGTAEVADCLARDLGERFVLLKTPNHAGLSAARNVGIDYVADHPTEFLTYLDADDWFEEGYLADMHSAAIVHGTGLVVAGIVRSDGEGRRVLATEMVRCPNHPVRDASSCVDLAYLNPCSYAKLFRFAPISDVRFRDIKRSEDTCYLFEALPHLGSVVFTNRALYHYCVHAGSLSSQAGEAELLSMHRHFADMLPAFACGDRAPYRDLFESQVFIRSSIGGVMRLARMRRQRAADLLRDELAWLDDAMPTWRANPYLSFGKRKGASGKERAVKLCAALYQAHAFGTFIGLYGLFSSVFGREVRW